MKKDEKCCSNCRYQMTGWDGGFFGLPFTCECQIFGETENRKDCKEFKRPFPKGLELLTAFMDWMNKVNKCEIIERKDIERFRREWE